MMKDNISIAEQTAKFLLQIKAIKLRPSNPFTWASGWKSPIYCDNRKTLSYPEVRRFIAVSFAEEVRNKYPRAEVIAGVATGGIAIGVMVAELLDLPFIYVRSSAKAHGMTNQIEGAYEAGQRVVVIEDLISTGGSSLKAVEALRNGGCNVFGMLAIFSYGFDIARTNFSKANCDVNTLSDYETLIQVAKDLNKITESDLERLGEWRKNPADWK